MKTEIVKVKPPMALILDMSIPTYTGKTYGDVVEYAITLKGIVRGCNASMESLREWSKQ